jgi:GNAT superfamily N-acetyltransferase
MSIRHRKATLKDAPAIADLHARSWRATYRGSYRDEYLDGSLDEDRLNVWTERLSDPPVNQFVVVAAEDGRIVGFACVYGGHDEHWGSFLDNIHTDPQRHGEGIGTGLFLRVADWCRQGFANHGLHLKVLERNTYARRFYLCLGGTEHGSVPPSNPWVIEGTRVVLVTWRALDVVARPRDERQTVPHRALPSAKQW